MRTGLLLVALVGCLAGSAAHAQDVARGKALFEQCAACHSLERGVTGVGPSLHGVVGRKAGAGGEFRYSPALRRSGITWSAATLEEFVADPQKRVPDNRMPFSGLPDAADRAALVAYLIATLK